MANSPTIPPDQLIEHLTRREQEILVLLSGEKSNKEIADQIFLALSSVKEYNQRIYQKLGVKNRRQAIQRARELGLLEGGTRTSTPKHNLPAQLTSFIGREEETEQLIALLKTHRLVTLTGSGGTGKSRLALRVASELFDLFPNGIWLVELASLSDPALVPKAVASAMNLPEMPANPILEILNNFLKTKRLLLILDNCEHLLDACAGLANSILRTCPEISILTSSREVLGVEGEALFRVPAMSFPDTRQLTQLDSLSNYDAVRLFVERAQVTSPDFAITVNNAAMVVDLVCQLDGIPLAIELAAARLNVLGIEQIVQRLNNTFHILTGGGRTALPHHQTLRASIDWSHDLLTHSEQILLRRLSVFVGGWRLKAAEQVCANGAKNHELIKTETILDLLSDLVAKSLVIAFQESEDRMRYRMLETIRQYANEKLVLAGELETVRERMLVYYLDLVERLEPALRGREQIKTLKHLEIELDNLRYVLEWALQNDIEASLRLASSLQWFWYIHFHWSEGIEWLKQALDVEKNLRMNDQKERTNKFIRARALLALGFLLLMQYLQNTPTLEQAKKSLEECLAIYRRTNQEQDQEIHLGKAWALVWLSNCLFHEGALEQSLELAQEALSLFHETGDSHGVAESLQMIGKLDIDPMRRMKIYQEQLAIEKANGDFDGIANALGQIGDAAANNGDYDSACSALEASREQYQLVNDPIMVAMSWLALGIAEISNGKLQQADECIDKSLVMFYELGYENRLPFSLFFKCLIRIAQGRYDQATDANEEAWLIYQKTHIQSIAADVFYSRARLARLSGDLSLAQKHAEELINYTDINPPQKMLSELELGHLALQCGDLKKARLLFREGIQFLIHRHATGWIFSFLDGLAFLAARDHQYERAARLFGTRWCRGYAYFLSPIEWSWREADLTIMKATLRETRYTELLEEGSKMTFDQVVDFALRVD